MERVIVAAGLGKAFRLCAGEQVRVGLAEGPQVVDLFAFSDPDLNEMLSTEHTRSCIQRLAPVPGEPFYSNRRRPMLGLTADSSPGIHDLLLSACDLARYALLGHSEPHRSCADNLIEALGEIGLAVPRVPSPVNLFERVTIGPGGRLSIEPPLARRGDAVTLQALMDQIVVVSACPMDIAATNGADRRPKSIFFERLT